MSIHMKKGKKRTEGFTLVELICVIAILGILVAIAVPSYRGIQDKSVSHIQCQIQLYTGKGTAGHAGRGRHKGI